MLQYVTSKLTNAQQNRYSTNNGASTQVFQQYFTNQQQQQQQQMQSKLETRSTRNVHTFDEKLNNVRLFSVVKHVLLSPLGKLSFTEQFQK